MDWPYLWSWRLIYGLSILPMWVHNPGLSISLRWWRTRRPVECWGCQSHCDLSGWKQRKWRYILKRVSREEDESLSTMPYGRQEGKQKGGRRRVEGGGWKREHKRLLLVIRTALNSTQGCGALAFSSLSVSLVDFFYLKNSPLPHRHLGMTSSLLTLFQSITSIVLLGLSWKAANT